MGRIARGGGHPDWRALIGDDWPRWQAALAAARAGDKVLIATGIGGHLGMTAMDSVLAVALTLRGAEVQVLLCDATLPACQVCEASWYPDAARFAETGPRGDLCGFCYAPAETMFRGLGVTLHRYGDQIGPDERALADRLARDTAAEEIAGFELDGLPVGEHARAGALRFFARGSLDGEIAGEAVLRRYFRAALYTVYALRGLLRRTRYRAVVAHHGIYVPQGMVNAVAKAEGVRLVTWNPGYRKQTFIFSHGDTYHHTMMDEPAAAWESLDLGELGLTRIRDYLASRRTGSQDWIWFHERPRFDPAWIERQLGVDFAKPCVGLLTNVVWDAQLHYPVNAFPGMLAWLIETIGYFAKRPELQLLVRVHPAELHGTPPSRQRAVEEIKRAFPKLPANVFIVAPESRVSTYALLDQCLAAVIYGTKMGVELTSIGKPVIVAGEAWIRNKGLTLDAASREDYFALLDRLPGIEPLDDATVERANRYAFHFFFRRMIALDFMAPTGGWPPYRPALTGLETLGPGSSSGLDVICEGILSGSDFIHRAEAAGYGAPYPAP